VSKSTVCREPESVALYIMGRSYETPFIQVAVQHVRFQTFRLRDNSHIQL
jgi:hypothetical protein